ncbi:unnamed protein product [Choristocarpus tenellus]
MKEGELEEQKDPPLFILPDDNTGSGIDYRILDKNTWETLRSYCQEWGIKQGHLEMVYNRFKQTILQTEHLDFTTKPFLHVSLDFIADEFMGTSGEFAGQLFLQTWFLRPRQGLNNPLDGRCIDFARLVMMSCDLARLGDYELLSSFWACVLQR